MINRICIFIFLFPVFFCHRISAREPFNNDRSLTDSITFYDGQTFTLIGKMHNEKNYVRFPQKYKGIVRDSVWESGRESAGISIRFRTNASLIVVRWTVKFNADLPHMPATGVKGMDLYALDKNYWQFVNTGIPHGKINEFTLLKGGDGISREYLLNLPLYDGVDSLSIGVNSDAEISNPTEKALITKKPVIYYGGSITQGGVATRPGMAFTNILSRKLDRSFINMGFSGEGTFDISVGEAMVEVDAALYVIDCTGNTKGGLVYDGAVNLVRLLKSKRPNIPVLLVEGFFYDPDYFTKAKNSRVGNKRVELKKAFETLKASGVRLLYYQKGDDLIGNDHEATVDGVHLNDIGMMRFAENMLPVIRAIIH